ncbi:hypothetical protein VUR80DRAFT_2996 [Thermomyces stellatus]
MRDVGVEEVAARPSGVPSLRWPDGGHSSTWARLILAAAFIDKQPTRTADLRINHVLTAAASRAGKKLGCRLSPKTKAHDTDEAATTNPGFETLPPRQRTFARQARLRMTWLFDRVHR